MADPILEVEDLTVQYETPNGPLTAVADASFTIEEQEYFGLVGESGCGKSTIAKAIMGGLDENGSIESGTIRYKGTEIQDFSEKELNQQIRWKEISWIPQGSMSSLDPLQRISEQAVWIGQQHTDLSKQELLEKLREQFERVGIHPSRIRDYPHQFSGGMQQRTLIAFALFLEPSFIIADEPTTALDVIMQDQIFENLDQIRRDTDIAMLLITHDISLEFETVDRLGVMHAGQISEIGDTVDLYRTPRHPYSILLQEAFPDYRYPDRKLSSIEDYPPENLGAVNYCTFADRCPWVVDECRQSAPAAEPVADDKSHLVSCFRRDEVLDDYRTRSNLLVDIHAGE